MPSVIGLLKKREGIAAQRGADLGSAIRVRSLRHLPVDAEDRRSYRRRTEM
jgi:hypothetical protein